MPEQRACQQYSRFLHPRRREEYLSGGRLGVYIVLGAEEPRRFAHRVAHVHAARVKEDFVSGTKSGVSGTPRFFINGRRHEEPGDAKTLAAALRRAL